MNNEQILAAARKEKSRGKEFDNKEAVRGDLLATIVAISLIVLMGVLELVVCGSLNFGYATILLAMCTVPSVYQGIKLKKVFWLLIGAIQGLLAIVAFLFYVGQVLIA